MNDTELVRAFSPNETGAPGHTGLEALKRASLLLGEHRLEEAATAVRLAARLLDRDQPQRLKSPVILED